MLIPVPKNDCLRAREAASVRLDGELSELETARLTAHLRECVACSVYALELSAIAESLRSAELEQPQLDLTLPRRRALPGLRVAAAAAAVIAVAAGSAYAVGQGLGSSQAKAKIPVSAPSLAGLQADTRNQHLFAMLRPVTPQQGEVQAGRLIFA
jgi:predicted anti-sigma-YlaC factor YlaD